jgi:hypothetical protein
MSNHKAIHDFVNYWQDHINFVIAETGNCTFPAVVEYTFDRKTIKEDTNVTIIRNGYDDGKVSIQEQGALSTAIFHLDFSSDLQKYMYKKANHAFVVSGSSKKMHGSYTVIILPSEP